MTDTDPRRDLLEAAARSGALLGVYTDWAADTLALDDNGWPLTGDAAGATSWLETSAPAVFAVGHARAGSPKRFASTVGEGARAIRLDMSAGVSSNHAHSTEKKGEAMHVRVNAVRGATRPDNGITYLHGKMLPLLHRQACYRGGMTSVDKAGAVVEVHPLSQERTPTSLKNDPG